tara:strand:- start:355 stop:570 length:216 start_codon:yes stop_codon:yes gene_type:complete
MLEEPMHSIKEVAKFLNVSKRTVQRLIKRGEIEVHRVGSQVRITTFALEKYLRRGEMGELTPDAATKTQLF